MATYMNHDMMCDPANEWAGIRIMVCKRCGKIRHRFPQEGWPSSLDWFDTDGNQIRLRHYDDPPCVERDE